jgi:hypothetical protein
VITGGGLEAVTLTVAALSEASSSVTPDETVAVLVIVVPWGTAQLTLATRVMVAEALTASEAKSMVRLLPAPPQTPPPVAPQETNVVDAGRLSVTVTVVATLGPRLVTVSV